MQTTFFLDRWRRGNLTLKRGEAGRRVKSCSECSRSDFGTLRQQQKQPALKRKGLELLIDVFSM